MTAKEIKQSGITHKNIIKVLQKKIIHSIATYINILTLSLPLKTKKLVLTLTMTILSHIWKTRKITISHHNYTHNYTIINIKQ